MLKKICFLVPFLFSAASVQAATVTAVYSGQEFSHPQSAQMTADMQVQLPRPPAPHGISIAINEDLLGMSVRGLTFTVEAELRTGSLGETWNKSLSLFVTGGSVDYSMTGDGVDPNALGIFGFPTVPPDSELFSMFYDGFVRTSVTFDAMGQVAEHTQILSGGDTNTGYRRTMISARDGDSYHCSFWSCGEIWVSADGGHDYRTYSHDWVAGPGQWSVATVPRSNLPAPVPLPAGGVLLGAALLGLARLKRLSHRL